MFKELHDKKVIGQSAAHIFSPYPELLEAIMQGSLMESKVKIPTQADLKYYHVRVSEVCDRSQIGVGKMLLLSDVTEAVHKEERLRANSRQLSELNAFKDKMFTVVAHDIRDPLSLLIGLMGVLKDEIQISGEKHEEVVYEMEQQIQNTFTLVESLLDWFRNQRGGMMFNPIVWNLSQSVQSTMRMLQVQCDSKRIQIIPDIASSTFVYADKEMLDSIIRNLLSNAIKFSEEGGSIQIKAVRVEDKVIVSVKDHGLGMSPDQAQSLLQEDYPTPLAGKFGEKGVGLGLTLCREFVRLHGGDIWFNSSPDQGSIFYFSIANADGRAAHAFRQVERTSTG